MNDIVLRLQKVTKTYGGNGNVPFVEIFKGLDFYVKRNEVDGIFLHPVQEKPFSSNCRFIR